MLREQLWELVGTIPTNNKKKEIREYEDRMRFHQGWWRTFIMCEEEGTYKDREKKEKKACNQIAGGNIDKKDYFLTEAARKSVADTLEERKINNAEVGIISKPRLFNNLLSSQPLSFNFFGNLKQDRAFATQVIKCFYPQVTDVKEVWFEYPWEKYIGDRSAFDVAFLVKTQSLEGLIAFECKYVNEFSKVAPDRQEYRTLFQESKSFLNRYEEYRVKKFDELFRNQLIAEGLLQNKKYGFVWTGLFCNEVDKKTMSVGQEFKSMLKDGQDKFKILTYSDYLSAIQKLDLTWEQREWTMLLWARYSGLAFSEALSPYKEIK